MAKRKGNEFGRITRRSDSKQVNMQKSKPVKDRSDDDEKEKMTMYLSPTQAKQLRRLEFGVREELDNHTRQFSRAKIVAEAIQVLLDDYAENGIDCEVIARLR